MTTISACAVEITLPWRNSPVAFHQKLHTQGLALNRPMKNRQDYKPADEKFFPARKVTILVPATRTPELRELLKNAILSGEPIRSFSISRTETSYTPA